MACHLLSRGTRKHCASNVIKGKGEESILHEPTKCIREGNVELRQQVGFEMAHGPHGKAVPFHSDILRT
jgi:hypothetical protein